MSFADDWDHWANSFPPRVARGWRDFLDAIETLVREVVYTPAKVDLATGSLTGGDIDSVQAMNDGDTYDVDEVTGVPGFAMTFTFSGITTFDRIFLYLKYNGSSTHFVYVQLYNYTTTSWDTQLEFSDHSVFELFNIEVYDDTDYIDSGAALVRLYHVTTGNAAHDISIDYVALARAGVKIPA